MQYPVSFENLIECFKRLPGVGAKTAERYAYEILEMDEEQINLFVSSLDKAYHNIHACKICGNLTEDETCDICKDSSRDKSTLCVVTHSKDVLAMEKIEGYAGVYHVLGGEISTSKGVLPNDLRIKELLDRIDDSTKEVIIATNPTMDGETTALYIAKLLEGKDVIVSRIAHGLPMGGHLDYADELTLLKAIEGRKRL